MNKRDVVLSILSGFLLFLSFPKFDLEGLAWVALVPLFLSIKDKGNKESFLLAYLTGVVFFSGLLYWIAAVTVYNKAAVFGLFFLVLYLSLYFGLFGLFARRLFSQSLTFSSFAAALLRRTGNCFFLPSLWVVLELIRTYLFSGFPWGLLGYSQHLNLPVIQISSFTGVYGISFLIVLVNVTLFHCSTVKKNQLLVTGYGLLITVLLIGASFLYGKKILSAAFEGTALKIAVVQGNINQLDKWDFNRQETFLQIHSDLTRELVRIEKPSLVVWPETAVIGILPDDSYFLDNLVNPAKAGETYLLTGGVHDDEEGTYNSAFLLSSRGIETVYDKIHLVPFGEFVPGGRLLPSLSKFILPGGGFRAGRNFTVFTLPQGKFSTLICYESIFPHLARRTGRLGVDFFVNITNDAWFGKTAGPYQHAAMVTFRAVENRRPLVRAANTGISLFLDPFGRKKVFKVGGEAIFVRGTLTEEITLLPAQEKTFYTRYGDIFAYLCIVPVFLSAGVNFLFGTTAKRKY